MKRARWIFRIAGIYGIAAVAPLYFLESWIGRDNPPPITHPEFFYGFAGLALAWQAAFLVISADPIRYRPLMIPAIVEKVSFFSAAAVLFYVDRISPTMFSASLGDLVFAVLFVIAFNTAASNSA